jgi:Leucine-rich repeat (LRR) protein
MNLTNLSTLNLQNNNLINTDTDYDADFITWLDQNNSSWRTQNSPAYCSSQLQLSATNYNVNEGDGGTTITVTRTNSSDGTVSVDYATTDDSATSPNDYTQTSGTLNWADGDDTDKSITIDITDDSEPEDNEKLIISLSNPTGGAELGEPDTATVTITDNDTFNCNQVTEIPTTECEALVTFYNSTNGDSWSRKSGWLENNTPCDWYGVTCSGGHVSELYLHSNELTGSIPTEIGNLSNLGYLYLNNNELTGTIPTELGNLSNLKYLHLYSNKLTGTIPSELGNLSQLWLLSLYSNELISTIPSELGNLNNLEYLHLYSNGLTGTIPSELGNLSNLKYLYLYSNSLTGTIPTELGNLNNLEGLDLHSNSLTGSIPTELGNLSQLKHLHLGSNSLTGTIPTELGNLSQLKHLRLGSNSLTGTIPTELNNLTNLELLWLHSNQLCGEIPSELKNLSKIRLPDDCYSYDSCLNLDNNHLTATDSELIEWLNSHNPGWEETQTPCPYQICKLQLSSAIYSVEENQGQATITVTRTDSSDGAVTIDYTTTDDSATSPDDYTQTSGTLNWNDGEDEDKTFTIDINNDSEVESDETLIVSLGNPTGGAELGEPDTAMVTITDNEGALIKGSVTLQGRDSKPDSSWETQIRVSLTKPTETQPSYSITTTTDQNGEFEIGPVEPLEYDMRIKGTHTLQKLVSVSLTPGENLVNVGVLLEGDTNDDNCVTILDFSKLAGTFGKCEGDSGFDSQTDFNQDGCVTILDFSLLGANFGQCGAPNPSMMVQQTAQTTSGTVVMRVATPQVNIGETYSVEIQVQAGEQQVDGASAYLEFDPTLLEVVNMTSGDHLNLTLENSFDNAAGSIRFAAGKLTAPYPSGDFELVTIRLRAKAATVRTPLGFVFNPSRRTYATFGGASVFEYAEDGNIIINKYRD